MFNKLKKNFIQLGFVSFVKKVLFYPYIFFFDKKRQKTKKILNLNNAKDRFTEIYQSNYWNSSESVSGLGSTVKITENLRSQLPTMLKKFNIETILDAPCGNFNWMKFFLEQNKLKNYIGVDSVSEIIKKNNEHFKTDTINFIELDIIKDPLPACDLLICKDCLIHFSYKDIFKFLQNFNNSSIKYLVTTNFYFDKNTDYIAKDIITGDHRYTDLNSAPINFSQPLFSIKDYSIDNIGTAYMDLFEKSQTNSIKIPKIL